MAKKVSMLAKAWTWGCTRGLRWWCASSSWEPAPSVWISSQECAPSGYLMTELGFIPPKALLCGHSFRCTISVQFNQLLCYRTNQVKNVKKYSYHINKLHLCGPGQILLTHWLEVIFTARHMQLNFKRRLLMFIVILHGFLLQASFIWINVHNVLCYQ